MEQIVTVRALYPDGTAEVACRRASACSGDCGHCGGCTNAQTVLVRAYNPIGAKPGDRVVVESASCQVLGAAAAVYLLPVLFLLGGYALAGGPWRSNWVCPGSDSGSLDGPAAKGRQALVYRFFLCRRQLWRFGKFIMRRES